MKFWISHGVFAAKHVHGGFDWESLGKATSVDIGGSTGHVSLELASQHLNLTLIVQDFAGVFPQFESTIPSQQIPDLLSGARFHDSATRRRRRRLFFKHVFHDWPDAVCVQILRSVIPAMRKVSRIIIMDGVVPEVGEVPNSILKLSTSLDLLMMSVSNAKERKQRDWEAVIKSAHESLIVKAIKHPPGSMASLIEVVLES